MIWKWKKCGTCKKRDTEFWNVIKQTMCLLLLKEAHWNTLRACGPHGAASPTACSTVVYRMELNGRNHLFALKLNSVCGR